MNRPRALILAGFLVAVGALSLVQDGMGMERWQAFESAHWKPAERTVPEAILCLLVAVGLAVPRSGRRSKPGAFAVHFCPGCGVRVEADTPEIVGNLYMVICPRGCGTTNVVGPRAP